MPALERPFGDQPQDLPLARRQAVDRAGFPLAAHQPRDHIWVEYRPAAGHPAYRVREHAQIARP